MSGITGERCEFCNDLSVRPGRFVANFGDSVNAFTFMRGPSSSRPQLVTRVEVTDDPIYHCEHFAFEINFCPMCGRELGRKK